MGLGLSVFRRRMKTPLYFGLLLFIKIIDLLHLKLTTQNYFHICIRSVFVLFFTSICLIRYLKLLTPCFDYILFDYLFIISFH